MARAVNPPCAGPGLNGACGGTSICQTAMANPFPVAYECVYWNNRSNPVVGATSLPSALYRPVINNTPCGSSDDIGGIRYCYKDLNPGPLYYIHAEAIQIYVPPTTNKPIGSACQAAGECASGYCGPGNTCQTAQVVANGKGIGVACQTDDECVSRYCVPLYLMNSHTCQNPQVGIGNGLPIGSPCQLAVQCNSQYCVPPNLSNPFTCRTRPAADVATTPGAPTNVTATAVSKTQINLSWTASTGGSPTGYGANRCIGVGCTSTTTIAINLGTGTTYSDNALTCGTTYGYSLFPNVAGTSARSPWVYPTTSACDVTHVTPPTCDAGSSPAVITATPANTYIFTYSGDALPLANFPTVLSPNIQVFSRFNPPTNNWKSWLRNAPTSGNLLAPIERGDLVQVSGPVGTEVGLCMKNSYDLDPVRIGVDAINNTVTIAASAPPAGTTTYYGIDTNNIRWLLWANKGKLYEIRQDAAAPTCDPATRTFAKWKSEAVKKADGTAATAVAGPSFACFIPNKATVDIFNFNVYRDVKYRLSGKVPF